MKLDVQASSVLSKPYKKTKRPGRGRNGGIGNIMQE